MKNYDQWKLGYSDFEPIEYIEKNQLDLEECKRALEDIVELLYTRDNLDLSKLDDCIYYLASELDVKIPDGEPLIAQALTEEQKQTEHLFQWWAGYTRAHAEMIKKPAHEEKYHGTTK